MDSYAESIYGPTTAHNLPMYKMDEERKTPHLAGLASAADIVKLAMLEERFHVVRTFTMLKKLSRRYGFFHPSFLKVLIGPLLPSKESAFTNQGLIDAVDLWCSTAEHRAVAEARYGHIRDWNTSQVTDMRSLFREKSTFNDDLSRWDTSKVTSMEFMFRNACAFNGNIHAWDTSSVTNMQFMFYRANAFNGDIHAWDVSKVTSMKGMFNNALAFNGDIHAWDVSNVTNMQAMFMEARVFNGDIHAWDVSNVTNMQAMFMKARIFSGDIHAWSVSTVSRMVDMFDSCPIPVQNKPLRYVALGL